MNLITSFVSYIDEHFGDQLDVKELARVHVNQIAAGKAASVLGVEVEHQAVMTDASLSTPSVHETEADVKELACVYRLPHGTSRPGLLLCVTCL